jgi:hypothetical protein
MRTTFVKMHLLNDDLHLVQSHLLYAKVKGENKAGHEQKGDKERMKERVESVRVRVLR